MNRGTFEPFDRWRVAVRILAFVITLSVGAAPSRGADRAGSGAWLLGLELQQRSFDTMSTGDARPTPRAHPGVRSSVDWLVTPSWGLTLSAQFGGAWLDWSDPIYNTAGKIEDVAWDARLGVDRIILLGTRSMAFVGAGIEYGEARSWAHTLGASPATPGGQDITDEGPHIFTTGGYARLLVMTPLWRRFAVCAQVSESFYGAHASDPTFGTKYNWIGRSLTLSAGLRFEIARGRVNGP